MAAVFESNSERDNNCPDLSFVSGIWVSHTHELKDSFKELVNTIYKTEAKVVDFQRKEEVVEEANLWASVASKGLITEVLKTKYLNEFTTVLFANALYFKGTWKEIFDEHHTRNQDFHLLNGDKISVPFMTGCKEYLYGSFEGVQVAKIPYLIGKDNKEFSMYIFLPKEKDGLPNLLTKSEF
ncbi:serpin-ZX-like [Nicotiana tomentosiformis]|uniref:serpin-ZX-like n=1 Tax=Nicotiana tomentosiformis TaxID=4098 RepID=UPI0014464DAE|nr:serpin-ZX-like [Nicotiana tomentosiformis]